MMSSRRSRCRHGGDEIRVISQTLAGLCGRLSVGKRPDSDSVEIA